MRVVIYEFVEPARLRTLIDKQRETDRTQGEPRTYYYVCSPFVLCATARNLHEEPTSVGTIPKGTTVTKEPEMFTDEVRYERFIVPDTFKRVKLRIGPTHGETVEEIWGSIEAPGKPKRRVVVGVELSLLTPKRLLDAKRWFEAEEGK